MNTNKIIEDKELGTLIVRVNPRARNFVFRAKDDAIYISVPPHTTMKELMDVLERSRAKLLIARQNQSLSLIDLNYKVETEYFKLSLISGDHKQFWAHTQRGTMQIVCPSDADFSDANLQVWLRKVIGEALRKNAKSILPLRLRQLSTQYELPFASVKINSSRGRWGSCSVRKDINLSYYLLLLPPHLIDYVLLHELCHTREMNHGEHFWELLNRFSEGKALSLRDELKRYNTSL